MVEEVAARFKKKYNSSILAGYRNGYFTPQQEAKIAKDISDSNAQMLFVGIASPLKEHFIHKHKEELKNINLIMGVGGSFDVMAGFTKRAPLWMQDIGLEWFFRFLQEPKRMWKRYLVGNTTFIYLVLKEKLKRANYQQYFATRFWFKTYICFLFKAYFDKKQNPHTKHFY